MLADIARRAPDSIVNLGDCATSPLWPRETFELLESKGIQAVRGNHDRWLSDPSPERATPSIRFTRNELTSKQIDQLGALPPTLRVDSDILAVHGTPTNDSDYLLEQLVDHRLSLCGRNVLDQRLGSVTERLILCGHSHNQHSAFASDGRLVVNPGSVGCPRYADNDDRALAEAGSPHARFAIATRRAKHWTIDMVVLEYDWSPVVQRARENGRADWATGFLSNGKGRG